MERPVDLVLLEDRLYAAVAVGWIVAIVGLAAWTVQGLLGVGAELER